MKSLNFIWNWLELYFFIILFYYYYFFLAFQYIHVVIIARARPLSRLVLDLVGGVYIE